MSRTLLPLPLPLPVLLTNAQKARGGGVANGRRGGQALRRAECVYVMIFEIKIQHE